jgi:hypothetical protein
MCHVSARRLSIYNFVWILLQSTKKVYGIYPTKFASLTQKHKKVIETPNQPIEIKKIAKKNMFSILKVKRRQKFVWGYPTEFAGSTQNPKKKYQNTKSTNHDENFSKKSMLKTWKKKRSWKLAWGLPDGICRLNPKS